MKTCCHSTSSEKPSAKKKLWNMKVTVIPIKIGALGIISKGFVKGLENIKIKGQVEIIQNTALSRLARILRSIPENWGDLLSIKTTERKNQLTLV